MFHHRGGYTGGQAGPAVVDRMYALSQFLRAGVLEQEALYAELYRFHDRLPVIAGSDHDDFDVGA